jgi:uncharacterized protein
MTERQPDLGAIDLTAFCRLGTQLEGERLLSELPRLAADASGPSDQPVRWSARGERVPVAGGEPELWLHLVASADVPLECQRCLQTTLEPLRVDRRFRFVRDEDEAARLDEESEDDVLALPVRLDLLQLLEDELILALPIVPRHPVCPQPLSAADDKAAAAEQAPHPFAALAALRGRPGADEEPQE